MADEEDRDAVTASDDADGLGHEGPISAGDPVEPVTPPTYPGEDAIPPAPLWPMRTRMHSNRRLEPGEEGRIRRKVGEEDDAVFVIDDGLDHCMIGRRVGKAPDGCVYCLVARISLETFADAVAGGLEVTEMFSDARDISLCGVIEEDEAVANVFLVQHYRRVRDVPLDYLPPSPFIEFTDDPDAPSAD
jgi:hypothetical protein